MTTSTYILGISAFYHNSAAALLKDGQIIAAVQEERFTRIRRDAAFPANAIRWCLQQGGITLDDITYVTFYDNPLLRFDRLLETFKSFTPRGLEAFLAATVGWLKERLFQKHLIIRELTHLNPARKARRFPSSRLLYARHHLSHAASAFYPSPYNDAVVLVLDGIGEWATTTVAIGSPSGLEITREIHFPHSLGLLYSAFTAYTGYRPNGGESTLMTLSTYGKPVYADLIRHHLVHVKPDGSFRLNMDYFDFSSGTLFTNARFHKLFGGAPAKPNTAPTQREMDLAASIQMVTEEIVLRIVRALAREYPHIPNLCLAGELALNSILNSKIRDEAAFTNVWVQPAASDSGGAIGAAYWAWHHYMQQPLQPKTEGSDLMSGSFLGPAYTSAEVAEIFNKIGAIYRPIKTEEDILAKTVEALAEGKAVGWFQGRAEFGERALGARSILGDPRNPDTQRNLGRESRFKQTYRPFAASVAKENAAQWFATEAPSPYMLFIAKIQRNLLKRMTPRQQALDPTEKLDVVRSTIPAVTHVDYTTRLHTVHFDTNRRFHALLKEFQHKTGCPILANTAFCANREPLVNTPADAFHCFMSTDLDMLVIEDHILYKEEQNPALFPNYKTKLSRS